MYKREVEISKVKHSSTPDGYRLNIVAKGGDTELKFEANGKGEVPVWAHEGKVLNVTVEVDRDTQV